MKTRFNCAHEAFSVFQCNLCYFPCNLCINQCNLCYFPSSHRGNAASCPLAAWLERGNQGNEMSEDISRPPILTEEGEQSLQWGCQVKDRAEGGGGFEGFCFISFSSQTFYQRSIQATPSMKITNLLKHFHQNMSIFTGHSLKKSREKPKLNLFFPSSSCPVNWKKSIICSYSATGVRNPTEHLWSWHFSLTSSSVQDPQFQWHLPVSALTRNT